MKQYYYHYQGFTLFEVMLAWGLFAIGFSAVSIMQLHALQRIHWAYEQDLMQMQLDNAMYIMPLLTVSERQSFGGQWQQRNQSIITNSQSSYRCDGGQCCMQLVIPHTSHRVHQCVSL
jgi:Tfp pilus assembly protein PilV